MLRVYVSWCREAMQKKEKSAAVFAVRRANYTHRRKGVFNVRKYRGFVIRWQCSLSRQEPLFKKGKATFKVLILC
jgi:hypothetical protein